MPILAEVREVFADSAEGIFKEIPRKARPAAPEINASIGQVVFKSERGRTLATGKQKDNGFGWEGKVFDYLSPVEEKVLCYIKESPSTSGDISKATGVWLEDVYRAVGVLRKYGMAEKKRMEGSTDKTPRWHIREWKTKR